MELEIFRRNPGEETKFRGAFDFDDPRAIPLGIRTKVSGKTVGKILELPLAEVTMLHANISEFPLTFDHFWSFCHRFSNNRFEHGDPESYQKAVFILDKLVDRKYKMTTIPKLMFASHDEKKIALIQDALEKLDCPIYKIPKLEEKRNRVISKKWNEWLDERRDPEKVVSEWGDLDVIE